MSDLDELARLLMLPPERRPMVPGRRPSQRGAARNPRRVGHPFLMPPEHAARVALYAARAAAGLDLWTGRPRSDD